MDQIEIIRARLPAATLRRLRFALPLLLALAAIAVLAVPARAVTVEEIPNPRPTGWTVDLTGSLSANTLAELNRIAGDVESRTGAQMVVVVVGTTGGAGHRDFATRLFNAWGIGQAGRDNGVLIFAALDDRAAEIVLGDGFPATEGEGTAEAIMQTEMVPRFRDGDVPGALLGGARACARRLLSAASPGTPAPASPRPLLPRAYDSAPAPQRAVGNDSEPPTGSRSRGLGAGALTILAGMLGLGGWTALRYRSRRCPNCKQPMIRLGEVQDDAHLTPAETTEERIGSADYDVWACASCDHVAKLRYGKLFSGYSECPACQTKALRSRSTTVQEATYTQGGLVRIDRDCAHCAHHDSSTRTTPRRTQHRRTSSFSGGGSRSGGFGGGRSSGRGASGRW